MSDKLSRAESEAILEVAGLKQKPSKRLFMALYYIMIGLSISVIGMGMNVGMVTGLTGRVNLLSGAFYFGAAVLLLCLGLYFRSRASSR